MESQSGETNSLEMEETDNSLKSSLISSTVSESIVDADKAGIVGYSHGKLKIFIHLFSKMQKLFM